MTKKEKQKEQLEAIEYLKKYIKQGDTLYTSVQKVSTNGMYRHIKVIGIEKNSPLFWSWYVANALGYPYKEKTNAIGIGGCGMDMGFHLIYTLSQKLFNNGYAIKQRWL
jgi:hypothetical protein